MSVSYGKLVEVTAVSGSQITFKLQEPPPSDVFDVDYDDHTQVYQGAPHEVTAQVGSSGRLYLQKDWLLAKDVPILTTDMKWPLGLSL